MNFDATIVEVFKNVKMNYFEQEWSFPKGRRNFNEFDLDCAIREFEEETNLKENNITKDDGTFYEFGEVNKCK